jgi:hypothetical protein
VSHYTTQTGMSLRDYFAAKALQGSMAYPGEKDGYNSWQTRSSTEIAEWAYRVADAMLEVRAKQGKTP